HVTLNAHVEHEQPKDLPGIGIDQKLGQYAPLDLTFADEDGHTVSLRQLIHGPIILALVYLHCPNVCSLLLQNLAEALNKLPAEPGREYTVLSISFDETEKPRLALQKKKTYLKMIEKPFPEDAWIFLTGDKENIRKLTDAIGFHFKRVGEDFEHPVALIILAPDGKIVRYMYGADPLPFDLKLALVEASQGRVGPTIAKVVRFCFSYDPKANKLVFNTLRVTGTVTLLFALSFIVFLLFKGRKQHTQEEYPE
ncbi:MAG: SCO family protein, partial [Thermodesulfobacteriota bacterium]